MRIADTSTDKDELPTHLTTQGDSSTTRSVTPNEVTQEMHDVDVDKTFILPMNKDPKSLMFDLSTLHTSSDQSKVVKSIRILVNYNQSANRSTTLHEDVDLFVTLESTEENEVSRNFEVLNVVNAMKGAAVPVDSSSSSSKSINNWKQYDVTTLLADYNGKTIRIHNENYEILNAVVVIELAGKQVSLHSTMMIRQNA